MDSLPWETKAVRLKCFQNCLNIREGHIYLLENEYSVNIVGRLNVLSVPTGVSTAKHNHLISLLTEKNSKLNGKKISLYLH